MNGPHPNDPDPRSEVDRIADRWNLNDWPDLDGEDIHHRACVDMAVVVSRIRALEECCQLTTTEKKWRDLKVGDKVVLTISLADYDNNNFGFLELEYGDEGIFVVALHRHPNQEVEVVDGSSAATTGEGNL